MSGIPPEVFCDFPQCGQTEAGIIQNFDVSSSAIFPANDFLMTVIHGCLAAGIESFQTSNK
jgi:hypothetical protein